MSHIQLPIKNTDESNIKLVGLGINLPIVIAYLAWKVGGNIYYCLTFFFLVLITTLIIKKFILRKKQISHAELTEDGIIVYSKNGEVVPVNINEVIKLSNAVYGYFNWSDRFTYRYSLKLSKTYFFGDELILGYKLEEGKTPLTIKIIESQMSSNAFENF
jgi:hypothetical protein